MYISESTAYKIVDWAGWVERHIVTSAIGYPRTTVESRLKEHGCVTGTVAGATHPECIMPEHIAAVDRIIRSMPGQLVDAIEAKYLGAPAPKDYRRRLEAAHIWIEAASRMGYLS